MANSDRLSTWLTSKEDFFAQERHSAIRNFDKESFDMFKGDPPRPPRFAAGQRVFASSSSLNPDLEYAEGITLRDTNKSGEGNASKSLVPGLSVPSNVQFTIKEVKKSTSDTREHRYIIQPTSVPKWEVSESTLLGAPFKPGDKVIKKGNKGAEIELVTESFVRLEADSKGKSRGRNFRGRPYDGLEFDLEEEVVVKPKVMLRVVDELNMESVVEAEKYRLADIDKGEIYFPINEHL